MLGNLLDLFIFAGCVLLSDISLVYQSLYSIEKLVFRGIY